jgi:hypothetical protein
VKTTEKIFNKLGQSVTTKEKYFTRLDNGWQQQRNTLHTWTMGENKRENILQTWTMGGNNRELRYTHGNCITAYVAHIGNRLTTEKYLHTQHIRNSLHEENLCSFATWNSLSLKNIFFIKVTKPIKYKALFTNIIF